MQPRVLLAKKQQTSGDEYPKGVAKWLSVVQILLGLSAMILFVVAVVVCRVLGILNVAVAIFFVVSGIFNLISAKSPNRSILVAVATASILSIIASGMFLFTASYGSIVRIHGIPVTHTIVTWEILQGVLMFLCLIEGILSIVFLVLASRTLCSCCQVQIVILPYDSSGTAVNPPGSAESRSHNSNHVCTNACNNGSHFSHENNTVYFQDYQLPPPDYKDVA